MAKIKKKTANKCYSIYGEIELSSLLVELQIGAAILEMGVENFRRIESRSILQLSYTTPWQMP